MNASPKFRNVFTPRTVVLKLSARSNPTLKNADSALFRFAKPYSFDGMNMKSQLAAILDMPRRLRRLRAR